MKKKKEVKPRSRPDHYPDTHIIQRHISGFHATWVTQCQDYLGEEGSWALKQAWLEEELLAGC